jgi:hypothetical protein
MRVATLFCRHRTLFWHFHRLLRRQLELLLLDPRNWMAGTPVANAPGSVPSDFTVAQPRKSLSFLSDRARLLNREASLVQGLANNKTVDAAV